MKVEFFFALGQKLEEESIVSNSSLLNSKITDAMPYEAMESMAMVSFKSGNYIICVGVYISKDHVFTTSTCSNKLYTMQTANLPDRALRIIDDTVIVHSLNNDRKIKFIIDLSNQLHDNKAFDVALIQVQKETFYSNICFISE